MRIPSLQEIIEKSQRELYEQDRAEQERIWEKEQKRNLSYARAKLFEWTRNFIDNPKSKRRATIRVHTLSFISQGQLIDRHSLQIFIDGEVHETFYVYDDTYLALVAGKKSEKVTRNDELCILDSYEPIAKKKTSRK